MQGKADTPQYMQTSFLIPPAPLGLEAKADHFSSDVARRRQATIYQSVDIACKALRAALMSGFKVVAGALEVTLQ
ncbi:hypothetical protein F4W66_24975 (plasmid) [Escherichia coli]|nr:hypothetical protein F4W66_24975 [Escherichia coli]